MYGADQDLLGLLEDTQCPVPILVIIVRSLTRRELFEIYAGAECAARAPYERDPDVSVVTDHFRGSIYVERALVIHRVKYLWTVQRQGTYSAGLLVIHRFKFHRYPFSTLKIVGSGQWAVYSEGIKTAHCPLPTDHFHCFRASRRAMKAPLNYSLRLSTT